MDSIYRYALLSTASFTIGVLVAAPSAFAIDNAGDLGGLIAGISALAATAIAFDAKNTWKEQIQHKYQHDYLIELKKSLLDLEGVFRKSRAVLHGAGRMFRVFSKTQGNEEASQASREYLENFKNDFYNASQRYQQCVAHAKIVSTPINEDAIRDLSVGINSLKIAIENELKAFDNNTPPSEMENLPEEFYKNFLNSIHIVFNSSIHD